MPAIRTPRSILIYAVAVVLGVFAFGAAIADGTSELYFIDAHSQMPKGLAAGKIIPLMDKAGVRRTILSARNDRSPQDVADFAAGHPERITAAVRSKGKKFNYNKPDFKDFIDIQLRQPIFKAMGEAILYHAQKGAKAPEINVAIDSPQSRMLLDIAIERKWPYIAHYEFRAAGGRKSNFMDAFEKMLRAHPEHPFVLMHMGQLHADDVERLIAAHPNVYFMMSQSNTVSIGENPKQPWVNLFDGKTLSSKWTALMLAHPDRFVLAFDNVWPQFWGEFYLKQAALLHKALAKLPPETAHALAHGNAERLWNLPSR